jgi:hypothetical protein
MSDSLDLSQYPVKVRVIPPVAITDDILVSSTAAEPGTGETAWNSGTTYAAEAEVYLASTHRRYISLQGSNTNKNPATATDYWKDIGPTNQWAMFDLTTNLATVQASPLTVVLEPGQRIDSLGLDGLVGRQVEITQTRGTVVTMHEVIDLNTREVFNWRTHFFAPFRNKPAITRFNIPPFTDATLTITITGPGDVACGFLVVGTNVEVGVCERAARVTGINYSSVTRDFAGGINTMQQLRTIPKITKRVLLEKERVNRVLPLKDSLNAVPAFWVGIDDDSHSYFDALQMVGFYRTFDMNLDEAAFAFLDLELEAI